MAKQVKKSNRNMVENALKTADALCILAMKKYELGEYAQAFELCQQVMQVAPTKQSVLYLSGLLAQHCKQYEVAKSFFMQVLYQNPKDSLSLLGLAKVFSQTEENDKAESCYEAAMQTQDNAPLVRYAYAQFLYEEKRYDETFAHLIYVMAAQPDDVRSHLLLGHVFLEKKNWVESEACFSRVLEMKEQSPDALVGLGMLCLIEECFFQAIEYFEKALVVDTNHEKAYFYLGKAFLRCDRTADAKTAFEAVLTLNSTRSDAQLLLNEIKVAQQQAKSDIN
jgi:tetratricopeptide (TPR) repeat protein